MNQIIFGTWGLGGAFQKKSGNKIRQIIQLAEDLGINQFDSAMVYGNGEMDRILGECLSSECTVATKIPAIVKPDSKIESLNIEEYYPEDYLHKCVHKILSQLRDKKVVLQLHNWHHSWFSQYILDILAPYRNRGDIQKLGVSIPDKYRAKYPENFNIYQSPFNLLDNSHAPEFSSCNGEKWARSIFFHGLLSKRKLQDYAENDARRNKITSSVKEQFLRLRKNLRFQDNKTLRKEAISFCYRQGWIDKLVVGFTATEQLEDFLETFLEVQKDIDRQFDQDSIFSNFNYTEDPNILDKTAASLTVGNIRGIIGAAVVRVGERLLVVTRALDDSHSPGYPELPGGSIDSSEKLLDGIRRELFEELGITSFKDIKIVGFFDVSYNNSTFREFVVEITLNNPTMRPNSEILNYAWFRGNDLIAHRRIGFHSLGERKMFLRVVDKILSERKILC
jgi:aryl-alcohol dehydrogenase-like predicted oxidoreductase/8-oxo-dGTP pyrophosphatase MutT (NUDIX family)